MLPLTLALASGSADVFLVSRTSSVPVASGAPTERREFVESIFNRLVPVELSTLKAVVELVEFWSANGEFTTPFRLILPSLKAVTAVPTSICTASI